MQHLGPRSYPVCLLDTNVVSEMVKDDSGTLMRNFYAWACDGPTMVPAVSPFTLMELRRAPTVFDRFVERFQLLPCMMTKGYLDLLCEERDGYPTPPDIDLCAVAFTFLGGDGNHLTNLPWMLDQHQALLDGWHEVAPEIVEGIRGLVSNFQPEGSSYTPTEIRAFVQMAGFSQLVLHDVTREFVKDAIAKATSEGDESGVDIDAFPSLKAMIFSVFYKFYADPNRRSMPSDAIDMLISSALPYVEAVVTENHQAESLRKMQNQGSFLTDLAVFRLRDFRAGVPQRPVTSASPVPT